MRWALAVMTAAILVAVLLVQLGVGNVERCGMDHLAGDPTPAPDCRE